MQPQSNVESARDSTAKQDRAPHLKPFRFKPGQSGNPKGRKRNILTPNERLRLLSEYAQANKKKANPVEAIREINKMENIYSEAPYQDNRQISIYVQSERAKELLGRIKERLTDAKGKEEG